MTRGLPWYWLGRVEYGLAASIQESLRERLLSGDQSAACVLLLEHDPVVTLGRSADQGNLVAAPAEFARRGVQVVHSTRGGDVTYHGPGQLVIYPIVRLTGTVVEFLQAVAGALGEAAAQLGVSGAEWRRDPAGLWVGTSKLAACGLHVHRGVSVHGWAFNVTTPEDAWSGIVPCGLRSFQVTSVAELARARNTPAPPAVAEVAKLAAPIICRSLGHSPVRRLCPFTR